MLILICKLQHEQFTLLIYQQDLLVVRLHILFAPLSYPQADLVWVVQSIRLLDLFFE